MQHSDTAIAKAVIALSHTLGLTTIAEGVDSEHQLQVLRDLGCPRAQGYHFARPLPPDVITAFLNEPAAPARSSS